MQYVPKCHMFGVNLYLSDTFVVIGGLVVVRSLSGKNWQDRDKADKVGISFSRDS